MPNLQLLLKRSICAYRVLLRLYPASFRKRFGDEMAHVFADLLADQARERPRTGVLLSWARVLRELPYSVSQQHALTVRERFVMSSKTWVKPFVAGAVVALMITTLTVGLNVTVNASRAESVLRVAANASLAQNNHEEAHSQK